MPRNPWTRPDRAALQRRARKCFALAKEQMGAARYYRDRKHLRSLRSAVFCARENVRLGRRFRQLAQEV